jgi:hypothetical protein
MMNYRKTIFVLIMEQHGFYMVPADPTKSGPVLGK